MDYVLAPPWVADSVERIVYEPFMYRLKGDHHGFYFDISEDKLFWNVMEDPYNPEHQALHSGDRKNVKVYLEWLHKYILNNNIPNRLDKLMENPDHSKIKSIDKMITYGCINAEKKC